MTNTELGKLTLRVYESATGKPTTEISGEGLAFVHTNLQRQCVEAAESIISYIVLSSDNTPITKSITQIAAIIYQHIHGGTCL